MCFHQWFLHPIAQLQYQISCVSIHAGEQKCAFGFLIKFGRLKDSFFTEAISIYLCDCGIASLLVLKILWLFEHGRSRFEIRLCCLVVVYPYIGFVDYSDYLNRAYFFFFIEKCKSWYYIPRLCWGFNILIIYSVSTRRFSAYLCKLHINPEHSLTINWPQEFLSIRTMHYTNYI